MMNQPKPRLANLIVQSATVLPFDEARSVVENCDIVVVDGMIADFGMGIAHQWTAPEVIDGRELILIPGLCNGHTHSPESLARGLGDAMSLTGWLETIWSRMDRLDEASIRLGILLCAAEMLHGGVTAVVDHFRQTPIRDTSIDAAAGAWLETGMKATLAVMIRDRGVPPWVDEPLGAEEQIDILADRVGQWHEREKRLWLSVGPSAPTRCTDILLRAAGGLCAQHGVGLHMHVDETRQEVALARELFGTTAIRHLDALGLLGPQSSLAHCVWCEPDDLELLANAGGAVVHNPVSNMRLGSGRAAVERMLKHGIEVVIGTDGAASNDSQSVLEAVKFAAFIPRLFCDDPHEWVTADQSLAMATIHGGRVFGMSDGRLATGCRADFAAFDRASLPLVPANDLYCQLAFAGGGIRARHVAVDGRVVLRDHQIQAFDEKRIMEEAIARHGYNTPG